MRSCCTHNIHLLCGQCAENLHFLLCGHLHSRAHYALNPLCGVPSDSMSVSGALKETCTPALRVGATPAYRDDEQVEVPVPAPSAAPTPPSNSARDLRRRPAGGDRGGRWDEGPEELAARASSPRSPLSSPRSPLSSPRKCSNFKTMLPTGSSVNAATGGSVTAGLTSKMSSSSDEPDAAVT